jgi:hypothetical protein
VKSHAETGAPYPRFSAPRCVEFALRPKAIVPYPETGIAQMVATSTFSSYCTVVSLHPSRRDS